MRKSLGYGLTVLLMPLYAVLYVIEYTWIIGQYKKAGFSWRFIFNKLRSRRVR